MEGIWLLFLVVFALNLLPAFAPPTWVALSFFSYKFPDTDIAMLARVGATAAREAALPACLLSDPQARRDAARDGDDARR